MNDETWMKAGMPMNLWAWPWQFWGEAAAKGMLPMAWWPQVEATITPLHAGEGTKAVRLSMRLRVPGEDAIAVEAVVARGGDVSRLLRVEAKALADE